MLSNCTLACRSTFACGFEGSKCCCCCWLELSSGSHSLKRANVVRWLQLQMEWVWLLPISWHPSFNQSLDHGRATEVKFSGGKSVSYTCECIRKWSDFDSWYRFTHLDLASQKTHLAELELLGLTGWEWRKTSSSGAERSTFIELNFERESDTIERLIRFELTTRWFEGLSSVVVGPICAPMPRKRTRTSFKACCELPVSY